MCFSSSEEDRRLKDLQRRIAGMEQTAQSFPSVEDQIARQMQRAALGPIGRTQRSTFAPPPPPPGFQAVQSILKGGG